MAAASSLDVANLALQRIGVKASSSLSGTDKQSVAANRILEDTRDEVQYMFPWECIMKRIALAPTAVGSTFSSFSYVHTLSSDCLRVLEIIDTNDADAENIPYVREGSNLYHNLSSGYLRYLKQTTNITPWSPLMLNAIEARMSSKLAVWLTGQVTKAALMHQEFMQTISVAIQVGAIEGKYEDNRKVLAMLDKNFMPFLAEDRRVAE